MRSEPTLVEGSDQLFHIGPTYWGGDWFATFEEGVPQVAIRRYRNTSSRAGKTRARARLREAGIKFADVFESDTSRRYFPPGAVLHFAFTYTFRLLEPIPAPGMWNWNTIPSYGYLEEGAVPLPGGAYWIAFSLPFSTADVLGALAGQPAKRALTSFVLDEMKYTAPLLRNEIRRQYPNADPATARQVYGEQMRLMRRSYRERIGQ